MIDYSNDPNKWMCQWEPQKKNLDLGFMIWYWKKLKMLSISMLHDFVKTNTI